MMVDAEELARAICAVYLKNPEIVDRFWPAFKTVAECTDAMVEIELGWKPKGNGTPR